MASTELSLKSPTLFCIVCKQAACKSTAQHCVLCYLCHCLPRNHIFSLIICISHGSGSRLGAVEGCLPGSSFLLAFSGLCQEAAVSYSPSLLWPGAFRLFLLFVPGQLHSALLCAGAADLKPFCQQHCLGCPLHQISAVFSWEHWEALDSSLCEFFKAPQEEKHPSAGSNLQNSGASSSAGRCCCPFWVMISRLF